MPRWHRWKAQRATRAVTRESHMIHRESLGRIDRRYLLYSAPISPPPPSVTRTIIYRQSIVLLDASSLPVRSVSGTFALMCVCVCMSLAVLQ